MLHPSWEGYLEAFQAAFYDACFPNFREIADSEGILRGRRAIRGSEHTPYLAHSCDQSFHEFYIYAAVCLEPRLTGFYPGINGCSLPPPRQSEAVFISHGLLSLIQSEIYRTLNKNGKGY